MKDEPTIEPEALPCPFCGSPATIEFWHGGGPRKRAIRCADEKNECPIIPSVCGSTRGQALADWNMRKAAEES